MCDKCGYWLTAFTIKDCPGCKKAADRPTSPGLCPDPIPDDIQEELTTLRARVKELEEIEIHLGGRVEDQRSKIRNLEERMANAAGKVLELARFIREMEANEEAWKLKESQITCDNTPPRIRC